MQILPLLFGKSTTVIYFNMKRLVQETSLLNNGMKMKTKKSKYDKLLFMCFSTFIIYEFYLNLVYFLIPITQTLYKLYLIYIKIWIMWLIPLVKYITMQSFIAHF